MKQKIMTLPLSQQAVRAIVAMGQLVDELLCFIYVNLNCPLILSQGIRVKKINAAKIIVNKADVT